MPRAPSSTDVHGGLPRAHPSTMVHGGGEGLAEEGEEDLGKKGHSILQAYVAQFGVLDGGEESDARETEEEELR